MPRKRQPRDVWEQTRQLVLARDGWRCARCGVPIHDGEPHDATSANVDHVTSGKRGGNHLDGLRSLCRRCHVLRADNRHRGMIAAALRDGIIPSDWRGLVWDDY